MPPDELPYELVEQIVRKLHFYDLKAVLSLCLVSRAFLTSCQQVIFEKLNLVHRSPQPLAAADRLAIPSKFIKLKETLERNPHLVQYVRSVFLMNLGIGDRTAGAALRCDWVLDNQDFFAEFLGLLEDAPIKTVTLQGEITGPEFQWGRFAENVQSRFYQIFAKGTVERVVFHNVALPTTFFGIFGSAAQEEGGYGGGHLKEVRLSKICWKDTSESESRLRPQRLQKLEMVTQPSVSADTDLRLLGSPTWLDLSSVRIFKVMLETSYAHINRLLAMMGSGLKELYVLVRQCKSGDSILDLSPLTSLEKLTFAQSMSRASAANSPIQMKWFADSLSSLSRPHHSIQSITFELESLRFFNIATFPTAEPLSTAFATIHQSSNLKSVVIRVTVARSVLKEQGPECAALVNIIRNQVLWLACLDILDVQVCSNPYPF
ncbi:hypothetical protein BDN72DRAFT_849526 [Pluteus cervinus]|uniref:Uncharacterized protein n=1 Tax=Pluteus cervinus TaxID=181527 RepID=A0ACD3A6T0_9AGAR|nr:hypothetical protein BDN72DRAFT_849526 [Pluteus cervinus]